MLYEILTLNILCNEDFEREGSYSPPQLHFQFEMVSDPQKLNSFSSVLQDLYISCLQESPSQRPSFSQLLQTFQQTPFFSS